MFDSLRFGIFMAMVVVATVAIITITLLAGLTTRAEFTRYVETGREIREEQVARAVVMWANNDEEQSPLQIGNIQSMQYLSDRNIPASALDSGEYRFRAVGTVAMLEEVNGATNTNSGSLDHLRFEITADGEATLYEGTEVIGTIFVDPESELELIPAQNDFMQNVNLTLLSTALVASIAAITLTVILSRRILHPVAALTIAVREMEAGDLSQRVQVHAQGEIAELAHAFNSLATTLNHNEELRKTMVSDIAHELRTPLTNIRGYLEAIQDHVLEPDPDTINLLHEEATMVHNLINDLQELALAESRQLRFELHPTQLVDAITQSVGALQQTARYKGVRLIQETPSQLPLVMADDRRVGQVLHNLINNAITHTPEGGTVRIQSSVLSHVIEVRVQDNGEGIEAEHLPYVFERFYRADPSRSRATGGAGLGLAIVKNLVEAQGGHVRVDSVKSKGSTFCFTLPRCTLARFEAQRETA